MTKLKQPLDFLLGPNVLRVTVWYGTDEQDAIWMDISVLVREFPAGLPNRHRRTALDWYTNASLFRGIAATHSPIERCRALDTSFRLNWRGDRDV